MTRQEYNEKLEEEIRKFLGLENVPIDVQEQSGGGAYIYSLKVKVGHLNVNQLNEIKSKIK